MIYVSYRFVLQTCPVVSKIDFISIARQFAFLQRSYMAAALLIYANEEQRTEIKKVSYSMNEHRRHCTAFCFLIVYMNNK